jgi:hypothetical protein
VSEYVDVKIEIQEASQGNVLMMEFLETKSSRNAKFCIFKDQLEKRTNSPPPSVIDEQE